MQTEKNGFVFYFDNLPILMSLPTDQWGWVIAALCRYAQEVWQNPDFPVEQAMAEFPALSGEGMTACRFMGRRFFGTPSAGSTSGTTGYSGGKASGKPPPRPGSKCPACPPTPTGRYIRRPRRST